MEKSRPSSLEESAPDERKLTALQASRLGALANLEPRDLVGLKIAEIDKQLRWRLDPAWLLFRKVCGRVVKKDPVTGVEDPVPFATVQVEDTDCTLLSYFPAGWPWGWFFPLHCHREVLATVRTDKCGNFCAWVPRFDIDWILHWRKRRICFPIIFTRPSLRDLLQREDLRVRVWPLPPKPDPDPEPDPRPWADLAQHDLPMFEAIAGPAARRVASHLMQLEAARAFGAPAEQLDELTDMRAFDAELPPPLPAELHRVLAGQADVKVKAGKVDDPLEAVRAAIALHLGVHAKELARLDVDRFIGPFRRCFDIYLPCWHLIHDVPDITFRVTQDVNGDGVEETIYGESFFDVRWNAGSIPNVTLVASPLARESHVCEDPPAVPCGNTPAILFAGLMPLTNAAYFDAVEGYAKRPNRPVPPAGPRPVAKTPFLRTLQLYGCVNVSGAKYYRVLASTDNGATFAAITGRSWNLYPIPSGPPVTISPDAAGWYAVLTNPTAYHPANMVLEWATPTLGKVVLKLELGNAAKGSISFSPTVAIRVDNTAPSVVFTKLAWKLASEGDGVFALAGRNLLVPCPTIRRGAVPQDIDIQFEASVAANHLRDAYLYTWGCGGGAFALTSPADEASHWHENPSDNSVLLTGRYHLAKTALEGAYGFGCRANSRGMNPSGGDGGHLADWLYDPIYIWVHPEIGIAVLNA